MTSAYACQHPKHQGDRYLPLRADVWTKRTTYRRLDGSTRLHERTTMVLCRRCVDLDAGMADEQEGMFG